MIRIDTSEMSLRCFRSDHNIQRLTNDRRWAAADKHGDKSIESQDPDDFGEWFAILMEEIGELAHEFTYDADSSDERKADELLDVIAVASAWYDALRIKNGKYLATRGSWIVR